MPAVPPPITTIRCDLVCTMGASSESSGCTDNSARERHPVKVLPGGPGAGRGAGVEGWSPARRAGWWVIAGYVLLVAAWALGNPAFAAPDEPAQYIRGLA